MDLPIIPPSCQRPRLGVVLFALTAATACDVEPREPDELVEDDVLREEDEEPATADPAAPVDLAAHPGAVGFDTDRRILVYDADGDSFPDITEQLGGSDLLDPSDPGPGEPLFPTTACRAGFAQAGSRLCISQAAQNATTYRTAVRTCRNLRAQVCNYEDLTYLYYSSGLDANYNVDGKWIGNMVGDDEVLCGNKSITFNNDPDIANFEGTCNKNNSRSYWCCHDDE